MASASALHFRVYCREAHFGDEVGICGSTTALGEWKLDQFLPLKSSEKLFPQWVSIDPIQVPEQAKYKIVIRRRNGTFRWESLDDREIVGLASKGVVLVTATFGVDGETTELLDDVETSGPPASTRQNSASTQADEKHSHNDTLDASQEVHPGLSAVVEAGRETFCYLSPTKRSALLGTSAGSILGFATGASIGAACGIVPAIFTFGISIPVMAALGGATGMSVGAIGGGMVGALGSALVQSAGFLKGAGSGLRCP